MRRNDPLARIKVSKVKVFVPASYSTKRCDLAVATLMNLHRAISLVKECCPRDGLIVLCSCSHPFLGAAELETARKIEILKESGVRYIIGKPIVNSIGEIREVKAALDEEGVDYKDGVCLVTCDFHSRAMRLITLLTLGIKNVFVSCNSYAFEVESDHPTQDQRTWGRWLWCSLLRYVAFKAAYHTPGFLRNRFLNRLAAIKHASGA